MAQLSTGGVRTWACHGPVRERRRCAVGGRGRSDLSVEIGEAERPTLGVDFCEGRHRAPRFRGDRTGCRESARGDAGPRGKFEIGVDAHLSRNWNEQRDGYGGSWEQTRGFGVPAGCRGGPA